MVGTGSTVVPRADQAREAVKAARKEAREETKVDMVIRFLLLRIPTEAHTIRHQHPNILTFLVVAAVTTIPPIQVTSIPARAQVPKARNQSIQRVAKWGKLRVARAGMEMGTEATMEDLTLVCQLVHPLNTYLLQQSTCHRPSRTCLHLHHTFLQLNHMHLRRPHR